LKYRSLVAAALMSVLAGPAIAQDSNRCFDSARLSAMATESGLNWEQRGPELLRVDLESRTRRFVRVVTSCGRSVVIVFAVLADAKDLRRSEELYLYLLQMASKYDHVKIGIDPDGDYLVRVDLRARTFDAKDLEAAARQVRNVVDELTPTLRAHAAR
jgi:hypothetical protein